MEKGTYLSAETQHNFLEPKSCKDLPLPSPYNTPQHRDPFRHQMQHGLPDHYDAQMEAATAPIPVSHTASEFHHLRELPVWQDDNTPQLHEGLPWTVKKEALQ
uniref:Uncharacterized protein n=1 Tax=Salix viminalis TaxID=40686 RepID=A0A6N2MNJ6_SALVM